MQVSVFFLLLCIITFIVATCPRGYVWYKDPMRVDKNVTSAVQAAVSELGAKYNLHYSLVKIHNATKSRYGERRCHIRWYPTRIKQVVKKVLNDDDLLADTAALYRPMPSSYTATTLLLSKDSNTTQSVVFAFSSLRPPNILLRSVNIMNKSSKDSDVAKTIQFVISEYKNKLNVVIEKEKQATVATHISGTTITYNDLAFKYNVGSGDKKLRISVKVNSETNVKVIDVAVHSVQGIVLPSTSSEAIQARNALITMINKQYKANVVTKLTESSITKYIDDQGKTYYYFLFVKYWYTVNGKSMTWTPTWLQISTDLKHMTPYRFPNA